jgi:intraflagellar transport protein 172
LLGYYYENVGSFSQAVDNFLKARDISRAQAAAERDPNPRERERLLTQIREEYKNQLESRQDAELLLRNEQVESGVQALVQQQDWERALSVSKGKDKQLFRKIILEMLKTKKLSNDPKEALRLLKSSKCQYFMGLESPMRDLIHTTLQEEDPSQLINLKNVLQNLLRSNDLNNNLQAEFSQVLQVSHLLCLRDFLQEKEEFSLAARVQFSLLRYAGTIPAYKAFFQAGQALRRVGMDKLAFIVLNVFLDMFEAVDESVPLEVSDTDNMELLDWPNLEDLPLPEQNFISENEKDSIRDWLLSTSSKYGTELCMDKTRCMHCGINISKECLSCPKCLGLLGNMCILSGEVISDNSVMNCSSCHKESIQEYFQKFKLISTNCPWCDNVYNE